MPLQLFEDAFGDPRNAAFLAIASDLAYLGPDAGPAAFKEQLGLDARLISEGHTQAYVAGNDAHLVAVFRGTEGPLTIDGLKDWLLANAVNLLIVPEGQMGTDFAAAGVGARFHKGFMAALEAIWPQVYEAVKSELARADRPLWLTGHSLGGALALLAAWRFDRCTIPVHQVYTFGAPMVGNAIASAAFDKAFPNKIFRYVNVPDPVPLLPTVSLVANDYSHCNREVALGPKEEAGAGATLLAGFASQAVDGLLNLTLIEDVWKGVLGRVAAHGLDQYRKLMEQLPGGK